jgi:hypothetical protein
METHSNFHSKTLTGKNDKQFNTQKSKLELWYKFDQTR